MSDIDFSVESKIDDKMKLLPTEIIQLTSDKINLSYIYNNLNVDDEIRTVLDDEEKNENNCEINQDETIIIRQMFMENGME